MRRNQRLSSHRLLIYGLADQFESLVFAAGGSCKESAVATGGGWGGRVSSHD